MSAALAPPDFAAIKQRQQATWAAGDYAVVGTTLQIARRPDELLFPGPSAERGPSAGPARS